MIYTGIVSVTFRKLMPREIIDLTVKAGLDGIEWGGDIHVPHGDIKKAKEVCKMTKEAGLKTASYGSYYRVGTHKEEIPFEKVLDSAIALESPMIRVWAGNIGAQKADEKWWEKVVDDTLRIADTAKKAGKMISFEYHRNTLTDTYSSAVKLMNMIDKEKVRVYWQPSTDLDTDGNICALENISSWLSNIHAFYWDKDGRQPLIKGKDVWDKYIEVIEGINGDRYCLLEFVKDDSTEQFLEDAGTLKKILSK